MTPRNDQQLAAQLSEAEARNPYLERRRQLGPPRRMTGRERRWLDPTKGVFKVFERWVDRLLSRVVYARLASHSDPYSRILNNRFSVAEISVSPAGWPKGVSGLRAL